MPSFKITIRKDVLRDDMTADIKYRVSHEGKTRYLSSKIHVLPKYFDKSSGLIKYGGPYSKEEVDKWNRKLQVGLAVLIAKAEKQKNLRYVDIGSLMRLLRDKHREQDVYALIDGRIERYEKEGNINYKGAFEATRARLEDFTSLKVIPFESVNKSWLNRFEEWMRLREMKPNSIGVHMRNLRTIYNQAINDDLVEISAYPFRKYRIPKEPTRKRNNTADEIRKIVHMDIKEPLMQWARDMWLLSLYLIGINMKDLAFIQQIDDGRIYYKRSKGKKPYSVKVYPEAAAIIDRYRGKKYLLNIMDNYSDYRTATKRINYKLKDIAGELKIEKPISTYYARHNFATIAAMLGVPKDDIAYALGHSIGNEMTTLYIDFNQQRIDLALRQVIDFVTMPPSE